MASPAIAATMAACAKPDAMQTANSKPKHKDAQELTEAQVAARRRPVRWTVGGPHAPRARTTHGHWGAGEEGLGRQTRLTACRLRPRLRVTTATSMSSS